MTLTFSLNYAAPETILSMEAGCKTILVDAAVDIWAIGVIAFELLTGERTFPAHTMPTEGGKQAIQDAIAGRSPLPWEKGSKGMEKRLEKLRGLRRTILPCLERDPIQRPTATSLLHAWDHAFDQLHSETMTRAS